MRARRDAVDLSADDAKELWARFSAWMDAHPGDLAGFAAELGVKSVRPALDATGPVLVVSSTETQVSYGTAKHLDVPAKREKDAAPKSANAQKSKRLPMPPPRKGGRS